MSELSIYAAPKIVDHIDDCVFYHTMDLPGHGEVSGLWDLRDSFDEYLGGLDVSGKRVLEIGPASGFLTMEMDRRGASVVAVELTVEHAWDFVPFSRGFLDPVIETRREVMRKLQNSFCFAHAAYGARAKVHYGSAYDLPDGLGRFDVATLAAILLHSRRPLEIIDQCARLTDKIIITDLFFPELEGQAVCKLQPTAENKSWDTWWFFSTDFFRQYLAILGFTSFTVTSHTQLLLTTPNRPMKFFTIVASR